VQNQVITAFRPHPETKNVSFDEDDMQKYGQDYFEKKVIMCDSKYTTSLQQNLQKVTTVPETVQELWRLTSVLGYARGRSELLTEFSRVERLFQQTSQALKVELRNALDWSSLESRLVEAIKELDSEELEDVLIKAEELLITGERLGERSAIDDFLKETQHLLPWLTIESAHVSKLARQRLLALGTCSEYATQLWSAVEDALNVVIMRADEATIRPMSTIAQTLFPEESFWHPILLKLKEIVNPISARCATWVNECSQMLEILPLSPVMGHAEMREEIFGVYGKLGATPPTHYKVFVVSADAPNGYDVTEFFMSSDALLWKTKNQEEVLVVIIAAEAPLEVQNLSELDQLTTQRGDLAWSTRVLKRSMQ